MIRSVGLNLWLGLLAVLASAAVGGEERTDGKGGVPAGLTAQAGLTVHLGCENGRPMVEHARGGNFVVHGLAAHKSDVKRMRALIASRGLDGRVSVALLGAATKLPYADNLVNRVVVRGDSVVSRLESPLDELFRILCPGGVVMLDEKAALALRGDLEDLVKSIRSDPRADHVETIEGERTWLTFRKKRPKGMAEWTHFRYGPEGNAVSPDALVGVPDSLRWIADSHAWPKEHFDHMFAAVSAGGRLFCIFDESPAGFQVPRKPFLIARDAYNGILLWKRPVPAELVSKGWSHGHLKQRRDPWLVNNLVAVGQHVFVPDVGRVLKLNASTGQIVRTYEDIQPKQIAVSTGCLFLTGDDERTPLQCLDATTGERRWKHTSHVDHFICGEGRVFFVDPERQTVCLDAGTGEPMWRKTYPDQLLVKDIREVKNLGRWRVVSCDGDTLITSAVSGGKAGHCALQGISADGGRHLWCFAYGDPWHNFAGSAHNAFLSGGLVWVNRKVPGNIPNTTTWVGLNASTGEVAREVPYGPAIHRCRPAQATERFFFCGSFDVCDHQTGAFHRIRAARNSCGLGVLPANGLLYSFPQSCECDAFLRGYLAFASCDWNQRQPGQDAANRHPLIQGSAFEWAAKARAELDATAREKPPSEEWPCYRHDARRSGATEATVSANLKKLWEVRIAGGDSEGPHLRSNAQADLGVLSAPVAAAGMAFVAARDRHQVVAVDAVTGVECWQFTAGGRIDSPPTIHRGLCLFGSHDGWVYCLRASDGVPVWRFQGAPGDRLIVADGQMESAWPIGGSVLVENDVLCFAAGRHTDLDGGLVVCALDPWNGEVIWKTRNARKEQRSFDRGHVIRMEWVEKGTGRWHGGKQPDGFKYRVSYQEPVSPGGLLASDGASVYLGPWPYGPARPAEKPSESNFVQTKAGFFDSSWNCRNWWMDRRVGGHLLSFNREQTFAVRMKGFAHRWTYRAKLHEPGAGFELFSQSKDIPDEFFQLRSAMKVPADWVREIAFAGEAMALTQTVLFVAGPPDAPDAEGGVLAAYSVQTGEPLAEYRLDVPPVFDGMAATVGRVYLATKDGRLLCFSGKEI
ncbi:MAG: outer membrane protein assembly factor BamB family protein [Planctomycetota bacterium]